MQSKNNQPKYYMLMEYLKEDILMGRIMPGEQIPSENVLAQTHRLSRHTVRKAISMLVNEGYLYTEHGRGTFCLSRSSKRNDSKNIGVIMTYISEYIFPRVIEGMERVLSNNKYSIILKNTSNILNNESLYFEDILSKDIEGLIIEPTKSALFSNNLKFYEAFDKHNIPYVFLHGDYRELDGKSKVVLDDAAGMYSVVEYLAKLGHKKIVGIFKADDTQGIDRHRGYAKALTDTGLPYDPDDVIWYHTEEQDIKPYAIIKQMLESKRSIDAIACYNDEIAFKMFALLNKLGKKVPDDISITGFDDSFLSENCPVKLTTVSHPKEVLGEEAAKILLKLINDNDYQNNPIQKIIVPKLVIKDSCRKR